MLMIYYYQIGEKLLMQDVHYGIVSSKLYFEQSIQRYKNTWLIHA